MHPSRSRSRRSPQRSTAQPSLSRGDRTGLSAKVFWLHNPASLLFQTSDHEPRGNRADSEPESEAAPATPHQFPTMLCLVQRDTTSPPVLTRSTAEKRLHRSCLPGESESINRSIDMRGIGIFPFAGLPRALLSNVDIWELVERRIPRSPSSRC
jgi:hypothetical protein